MPPMMYYGKGRTRNRNIPVLATGVEGETRCRPHARAVPGLNRYFAQIAVKGPLIRASGHASASSVVCVFQTKVATDSR